MDASCGVVKISRSSTFASSPNFSALLLRLPLPEESEQLGEGLEDLAAAAVVVLPDLKGPLGQASKGLKDRLEAAEELRGPKGTRETRGQLAAVVELKVHKGSRGIRDSKGL